MKIFVLHGEDTVKSYERFKKFIETAKVRSWEISYVDESNLNFKETLLGTSLFDTERFFILKDIKKLGKKEAEWLSKKSADLIGNLVIYHEGVLNITFLKSLPKDIKIEAFELPKIIWNFLEHLYPGNSKTCVLELHKIIERDPPEFVFTLIARLFRDLYWVKIEPSLVPYPSWRTSKLKTQSLKFSEDLLKKIINKLAEIDIESKTGKGDLVSSIDLLIIKLLK